MVVKHVSIAMLLDRLWVSLSEVDQWGGALQRGAVTCKGLLTESEIKILWNAMYMWHPVTTVLPIAYSPYRYLLTLSYQVFMSINFLHSRFTFNWKNEMPISVSVGHISKKNVNLVITIQNDYLNYLHILIIQR
jgi:hypothetical protein